MWTFRNISMCHASIILGLFVNLGATIFVRDKVFLETGSRWRVGTHIFDQVTELENRLHGVRRQNAIHHPAIIKCFIVILNSLLFFVNSVQQ